MIISEILATLSEKYKEKLTVITEKNELVIESGSLVPLLEELKNTYGFNMLAVLTAVEYSTKLEMVYRLMSQESAQLVVIKVELPLASPKVASIAKVWSAAIVQECEVFDMFGIIFEGHPNLRRILNPDDFAHFPLRKSFKLEVIDRQSQELLMKDKK